MKIYIFCLPFWLFVVMRLFSVFSPIFTELTESSRELGQVHRVLADPLSVSYLVMVSTQLVPSRIRLDRFFEPW